MALDEKELLDPLKNDMDDLKSKIEAIENRISGNWKSIMLASLLSSFLTFGFGVANNIIFLDRPDIEISTPVVDENDNLSFEIINNAQHSSAKDIVIEGKIGDKWFPIYRIPALKPANSQPISIKLKKSSSTFYKPTDTRSIATGPTDTTFTVTCPRNYSIDMSVINSTPYEVLSKDVVSKDVEQAGDKFLWIQVNSPDKKIPPRQIPYNANVTSILKFIIYKLQFCNSTNCWKTECTKEELNNSENIADFYEFNPIEK